MGTYIFSKLEKLENVNTNGYGIFCWKQNHTEQKPESVELITVK